MPASTDTPDKSWYYSQLSRLHDEAPAGEKTVLEEALRHLSIESLAEIIDVLFVDCKYLHVNAEQWLIDGDKNKCADFIKKQSDMFEQYQLLKPGYYRAVARIIAHFFIRKAEQKMGIRKPEYIQINVPKLPDSPLSGPPTPCSVDSWIATLQPSFDPILELSPPRDIIDQPSEAVQLMTTIHPQRQQPPRRTKKLNQELCLPSEEVQLISAVQLSRKAENNNQELPSAPTRRRVYKHNSTRGAMEKEAIPKEITEDYMPNNTKRKRSKDVISSHDVQVKQKRRRIGRS